MKIKAGIVAFLIITMLFPSFKAAANNEIYTEDTEPTYKLNLIEGKPYSGLYTMSDSPLYDNQWQTQMVNADFAWNMDTYGNEVNVAVIDTGCNPHEDINLAGGYNFILNNDDYTDNHGHGTHVAGIISAQHNAYGIDGIAPKVNIYALKCVDPYYSSSQDELVAAIYAAVDRYNCKVISMSLGITADVRSLSNAVKYAASKGVIMVAAVGNDGEEEYADRYNYPAAYEEVIGVGAMSSTKNRSTFSQKNDSVFVVAPGERYISTIGTTSYGIKSGTSQATPVVAGAAAILLSADGDMTPNEFKNYIINCSEPLKDDYCGYGLLNIKAMFQECIKDTEHYISPINDDGIVIFNNSDYNFIATGIFAGYNGSQYVSGTVRDINLAPNKKVRIGYGDESDTKRFFLWSGFEDMIPLMIDKKK